MSFSTTPPVGALGARRGRTSHYIQLTSVSCKRQDVSRQTEHPIRSTNRGSTLLFRESATGDSNPSSRRTSGFVPDTPASIAVLLHRKSNRTAGILKNVKAAVPSTHPTVSNGVNLTYPLRKRTKAKLPLSGLPRVSSGSAEGFEPSPPGAVGTSFRFSASVSMLLHPSPPYPISWLYAPFEGYLAYPLPRPPPEGPTRWVVANSQSHVAEHLITPRALWCLLRVNKCRTRVPPAPRQSSLLSSKVYLLDTGK